MGIVVDENLDNAFVVRHWTRLPRESGDAPSWEGFRARFAEALSKLIMKSQTVEARGIGREEKRREEKRREEKRREEKRREEKRREEKRREEKSIIESPCDFSLP
ncbi:hypothetical protein HGM15179_006498 [Zosterops borbonicus]|uniref:Uncharacterized protein n=1 Tax=Zosterops borbonicus TaxID=364589 RepID=A0A8K1GKG1_9PASS|nr:hypothetical protein HGM15179_006498 [Zosterops borbonicus]